jgi:hypothetical protein
MTWDEGSRYDASRVGLWETAAMAAISGILVTVGAWPWPMIGAFLAAGSLLLIGHYSDCSAVVATPEAKTTIQGPFPDYPSKSLSVEIRSSR